MLLSPGGRYGKINPTGIAFYNNLIDSLLLRGSHHVIICSSHKQKSAHIDHIKLKRVDYDTKWLVIEVNSSILYFSGTFSNLHRKIKLLMFWIFAYRNWSRYRTICHTESLWHSSRTRRSIWSLAKSKNTVYISSSSSISYDCS